MLDLYSRSSVAYCQDITPSAESAVRCGNHSFQVASTQGLGDATEQYVAFINPVTAMAVRNSKVCFKCKSAYNIQCKR